MAAGQHAGAAAGALQFMAAEMFTAGVCMVAVWVGAHIMRRVLDPAAEARERAKERRAAVMDRLLKSGVAPRSLEGMSRAEENLLYDLVFPEDITVSFASIGGLEDVKEALREMVVYPMMYPEVYGMGGKKGKGKLLGPPKGVLLYGPPGTGKTLQASALAKESGCNFLALSPSSLLSKWLGESEMTASAVFSLARRVAPTIIFIDEIDGLFRERSSSEHEVHKNLKAQFMQDWDGLATDDGGATVIVLGATNRPYDIDPAILRRMPRAFEVGLPSAKDRVAILGTLLVDAELADGFSMAKIADATDGYSGSDLSELLRAAMMQPVREALRKVAKAVKAGGGASQSGKKAIPQTPALRPLSVEDVLRARRETTVTQAQSQQYMFKSAIADQQARNRARAANGLG